MLVGLVLLTVGAIVAFCALPIFSYMKKIPDPAAGARTESVYDGVFSVDETHVGDFAFNLTMPQNLTVLATSNGNISCSIVNYTGSPGNYSLDPPDFTIYFSRNDSTFVEATWNSSTRSANAGIYHLVFLPRQDTTSSAIEVHANVTKSWNELVFKEVLADDRIALIDQTSGIVGVAVLLSGTVLLLFGAASSRKKRHTPA